MNEETIFQEALSRSPEERAAFLEQACAGRPDLRSAVEALLAAHAKPGNVLDKPPVDPGQTVDSEPDAANRGATGEYTPQPDEATPQSDTADYQPQVESGMVIAGRYTLVQKIGEGGMGEVWVAKQTEPVKRKVALKLIKTGMDSKAVLAAVRAGAAGAGDDGSSQHRPRLRRRHDAEGPAVLRDGVGQRFAAQ